MEVDQGLMYSCEAFDEILIKDTPTKVISPGDGILDLEPYPSADVMVHFSQLVYKINFMGCFEAKGLLADWRLLTTAQNADKTNDYFGAAFWAPSLNQVIIVHKGTDSFGALIADVDGVIRKRLTPQINSALTFSFKVMSVLRRMNSEGMSFQLSVTGHSLGGWLAQVTAFALKYLQVTGGKFAKIENPRDGAHVRAVVFESPGCRSTLSKIRDRFETRYANRSMFLNRLDITCYFSAVNRVNSYDTHLGTIYRLITGHENDFCYIKSTHSIDNMKDAFKHPLEVFQVLDWPRSTISWSGGSEYRKFKEIANPQNDHHPRVAAPIREPLTDRYHFRAVPLNCCSLRIFSEDELSFLHSWIELSKCGIRLTKIREFAREYKFEGFEHLFKNFKIDNESQEITSETLQKLIRQTKNLMRWMPEEAKAAMKGQMELVPSAVEAMYRIEGENYLRRELPAATRSLVDFRDDTVRLEEFLMSSDNILYIETPHSKMEMLRVFNILNQIRKSGDSSEQVGVYTGDRHSTFLDSRGIEHLESVVDMEKLEGPGFTLNNLLVIEHTAKGLNAFTKVFKNVRSNSIKKVVFVDSCKTDFEDFVDSLNLSQATGDQLALRKVIATDINLNHLNDESVKKLYEEKMFALRGEQWSLEELVGPFRELTDRQQDAISQQIGTHLLKNLLTNQSFPIEMEEPRHINDSHACSTINERVDLENVVRMFRKTSARLVASGICREDLSPDLAAVADDRITTANTLEDGEAMFEHMCRQKIDAAVYWIHVANGHLLCKKVFKKGFYMDREFHHQIDFDFGSFIRKGEDVEDTFIFQNTASLTRLVESVGGKKEAISGTNFKTTTTEDETEEMMKKSGNKPAHVFLQKEGSGTRLVWLRSRGSLEGLRPYVSTNMAEFADEPRMCSGERRVVIIADEPGMGKSTTLANVSRLLKSHWIINIDLKHFQTPEGSSNSEPTLSSVTSYLLNGAKSDLLRGLLQVCLSKEYKHSKLVYVLCDGFDEVKEDCASQDSKAKDEVLRILKFIKSETTANMWLATRRYTKDVLENDLSVFATVFQKLSEEKRREYLTMHWRSHLALELSGDRDARDRQLNRCAQHLYSQAKEVLGSDIDVFMGIPLQMRMLAEIYMENVQYSVANVDTDIRQSFEIDGVFGLFQTFKNLKYKIYLYDKTGLNSGMSSVIKDWIDTGITERHRILGLQALFPEIGNRHFSDVTGEWKAELNRVGLVQSSGNGSVEFTHRTLAEFFCADLSVFWLNQENRYHGNAPLEELLLFKILLRGRNKFIRLFVNDFLRLNRLTEGALQRSALKIRNLWETKQDKLFDAQQQTALHIASDEGNDQIVDFLIYGLKSLPTDRSLLAFAVAQDQYGDTALSLAAKRAEKETSDTKRKLYYEIMAKIVQIVHTCSPLFKLELMLTTFMTGDRLRVLEEYLRGELSVCPDTKSAFDRTRKLIDEEVAPFLAAVKGGQEDRLEELYSKMENDTERRYVLLAHDEERETALHLISQGDNNENGTGVREKIIHYIRTLNIPVKRMSYNRRGDTPLHCAASAGRADTVGQLLGLGADVDSENRHRQTALTSAALEGDSRMVAFLLKRGANVDSVDDSGLTALLQAIAVDYRPVIECLVENGVNVNYADVKGLHGLSHAARGGYLSTARLLVEKGADIKHADRKGRTALIHAARGGFLPVVTFLIDNGADIDDRDHEGSTALSHAALGGHARVVQYAQTKGADIDNLDEMGWSALSHAVHLGNFSTVKFLIGFGSDVNSKNMKGLTVLSRAAQGGNVAMIEILVNSGAKIDIADEDGLTALSHAAHQGHLLVVEALLEKGADVTSLSRATRGPHSAAVDALLKGGAGDPADAAGVKK